MEQLVWTKNPPSAPGFYWVKFRGDITVAKVEKYSDGSPGFMIDIIASDEPFEFKEFSHWCGPIVPPDFS